MTHFGDRHAPISVIAMGEIRIGEFAKQWIESKALRLDSGTLRTYADALENHILPALGDYFYDALTPRDVQRWLDQAFSRGWATSSRRSRGVAKVEVPEAANGDPKERKASAARRAYSRHSVAVWFRVFRTMTRDAMVTLGLQRDATLRVSLPEPAVVREESNSLMPAQLDEFLRAMRALYPQHYGLVVLLAYTGLRFCHASALRWEDWDEAAGVLRVTRKQHRGKVGPVSRKKLAPREVPLMPEIGEVLKEHRRRLEAAKAPGYAAGWMFPSAEGTLRAPSSLERAWAKCLEMAKVDKRFTVHGLRYTFTDLVRRANVDAVVRRALTGHVTEEMQRHYSTVGLDEKREAVAGVIRMVPPQGLSEPPSQRQKWDLEWDQPNSDASRQDKFDSN